MGAGDDSMCSGLGLLVAWGLGDISWTEGLWLQPPAATAGPSGLQFPLDPQLTNVSMYKTPDVRRRCGLGRRTHGEEQSTALRPAAARPESCSG